MAHASRLGLDSQLARLLPFALALAVPAQAGAQALERRAHDPAVVYLGGSAGVALSELGGAVSAGAGYFPSTRVAVGVLVRAGIEEFGPLFGPSVAVTFVEPALGLLGRIRPFTLIFDVGLGGGEASYEDSCLDLFGGGCDDPPDPPPYAVGTGSLGLRFLFHGDDGSVYGGGVTRLQTIDFEGAVLTAGGEIGYAF